MAVRIGDGTCPPVASAVGKITDYTVRANRITKVLDFVQSGGPDLTVGSTVFEIWMRL